MSWFQGIANNMSIQGHAGGQYGQMNATYEITTNDVSNFWHVIILNFSIFLNCHELLFNFHKLSLGRTSLKP